MSDKRRWLAIFIIGLVWTITAIPVAGIIAAILVSIVNATGYFSLAAIPANASAICLGFLIAGFTFASLITSIILRIYDSGKLQAGASRRQRIEKLLSGFEDHDLESLRDRLLTYEEDGADGEYESLEALLNQQKKKRAVSSDKRE